MNTSGQAVTAAGRTDVAPRRQVLALLDDAAAGAMALELSSLLAHTLQRNLGVVYVENTRSLLAAALPFTQVLSHAGSRWAPLSPQDVEQGFRAHAARLRSLAESIALRHKVGWNLRVARGCLADVALDLWTESDLLLLAPTPPLASSRLVATRDSRRRTVVAAVDDGSEAGARALKVAAELARSVAGKLETIALDAASALTGADDRLAMLAASDVLVLPRPVLPPHALAALRCQVLLVG